MVVLGVLAEVKILLVVLAVLVVSCCERGSRGIEPSSFSVGIIVTGWGHCCVSKVS